MSNPGNGRPANVLFIERRLNWKDRYREAAGLEVEIGTLVWADELCEACVAARGADLCGTCERAVWGDRP